MGAGAKSVTRCSLNEKKEGLILLNRPDEFGTIRPEPAQPGRGAARLPTQARAVLAADALAPRHNVCILKAGTPAKGAAYSDGRDATITKREPRLGPNSASAGRASSENGTA